MSGIQFLKSDLSLALPRLGLASLFLCLISGLILLFQYHPAGNVFQNVEEITTLIPYGWFFRQLHYGSGQVFVIIMLLHTMDHFLKKRYRTYSFSQWFLLIVSLFLCFFTLFTGFILKGDKEGLFAGYILLNILREIPMIGDILSGLFIRTGESSMLLPYLYHCFFLPLLIIFLLRDHIRLWFPSDRFVFLATIGLFLYALLFGPGIDIPPEADVKDIKGPWFFLGIQNLLRIIPSLWAGLVIPALLMGMLFIMPLLKGKVTVIIHYMLVFSGTLYAAFMVIEYLRDSLFQ
ncbi:MAG: cytochrome b N-terminal domain-containing protein [Pseudomonadota bacterium]